MSIKHDEQSISIHEAGHAVVGFELGFKSDGVYIDPGASMKPQGQTRHKPLPDGTPPQTIIETKARYLAVRAAGLVAEEIHRGEAQLTLSETGAYSDYETAVTESILLSLYSRPATVSSQPEFFMRAAYEKAREILSRPDAWKKVDKLAAALRLRRRLDGEEVEALLQN